MVLLSATQGLAKLGNDDDDIASIVAEFDVNHDGRIDYSEFCDMLRSGNTYSPMYRGVNLF